MLSLKILCLGDVRKITETQQINNLNLAFFLIYKTDLIMLLYCIEILIVILFPFLLFSLVWFSSAITGTLKKKQCVLLLLYELKTLIFFI